MSNMSNSHTPTPDTSYYSSARSRMSRSYPSTPDVSCYSSTPPTIRRSISTGPTSCYFCGVPVDDKYLPEHLIHCGAVLEECPERCGAYVTRSELADHQSQCPRGLGSKVHRTGASIDERVRSLRESAWKNKIVSILGLLRSALHEGEREVKELRDTLTASLQMTNEALRKDILEELLESRRTASAIQARLASLEQSCRELGLSQRESTARLEELSGSSEQARANIGAVFEMLQDQSCNVHDMRLELEMRCKLSNELVNRHNDLFDKIEALERRVQSQTEAANTQATDLKTLKFQFKEHARYVDEVARDLGTRPCCCERENVGRLLWRIDNFREKMDEAKRTDGPVYSPVFYDREYGYALRMELYLNGLGKWKNRHVIGCLRFVSGKWDPLLDWPCTLRANVILRNQENPANDLRKFVQTSKAAKNDDALEHDSDMYMFVPHTTLASHPGYTSDNVAFFDIRIRDMKYSGSTMSLV